MFRLQTTTIRNKLNKHRCFNTAYLEHRGFVFNATHSVLSFRNARSDVIYDLNKKGVLLDKC